MSRVDMMPGASLADPSSQFSWLRTRFSVERTLMSWVRTSTALIGFGFTIFQFFDRLGQMKDVAPAAAPWIPRVVTIGLVGAGTVGLVVAWMEYRRMIRHLWSSQFTEITPPGHRPSWTPTGFVAVMLCVIGAFALIAMLTRT